MRFSVFTPTHRPEHLLVPLASLEAQDFEREDFEWVIGVNNGAHVDDIPQKVKDSKINVRFESIPPKAEVGENIGYLKKWLCGKCKGDYLLELDHDDELRSDALSMLHKASCTPKHEPEFMYSDAVHIHDNDKDNKTQVYSGQYGWPTPYEVEWKGEKYRNQPAFPVSAASLYNIFFSPDHVRVWMRSFYDFIGGHDETLWAADDHELLQRTYIAGGTMLHLNQCLYIYHLHENASNSYLERNKFIQTQQQKNANKHMVPLVREWCRRHGLTRVELGASRPMLAESKVVGVGLEGTDINMDLRRGLPFTDNSVGHINAQDFLEHIPGCHNSKCRHTDAYCTVGMMNEIWRVLAPGGFFTSSTPSSDGRGAFQDPSHVSYWNPNSFWYYTRKQQAAFLAGNPQAKFINKGVSQGYPSDWHKQHHILYVDAVLIALKHKNQPGDNGFWPSYP